MNTSELLVKALENEGVDLIFGIPGEENVSFLEALRKSSIRYITAADERGAAFMAVTYGRLTGKPGVVSTTLGPGALNIPNGLALATLAGVPLVALTWQRGCRASNKDHGFMYVNVIDVFRPLVKYQQVIFSPRDVATTIREGFAIAQRPNFGAVHIELPEDVSEEKITENISFHKPAAIAKPVPDLKGIEMAAEVISVAKNPLIIVGFNACNYEVTQVVRNFAESCGIHVITTPMAQGVLPANNPLSLFSFTSSHDDLLFDALQHVDVIISIGYNTLEFSPKFWNSGGEKTILHVSTTPAKLHANYNPRFELIGDIGESLSLLRQKLSGQQKWNSTVFLQLRRSLLENEVDSFSFPVKPQYLVETMRKTAKNALIVHDNGMHKLWVTRFFHPDSPQQIFVDNALASIGSGIPQGIAAQLLHPQKKVLVNTGEGGLLMCLGELATAVSQKLPLVILVWHDGKHGMIDWHQQKRSLASFGVSIASPDFVKLAESFGGIGYRITNAEDLEATLIQAFSNNKLTIIDCPVDYSENLKVFYT